jgi:hypothetical protein
MTRRQTAVVMVAVTALAAGLRLAGLRFGLPAVYNQDEIAIMSRALAFAKGDLNPHNFLYPTLYFYVLFGWIGGYYLLARVAGWASSAAAFQASFFTNPTGIYLAGRLLSAACGVATVLLVWRLARRVSGARVGAAAALFMAVAPFAVRDAHYVKHDVPVTLAVAAAMLAMWHLWFGERKTDDGRDRSGRGALLIAAALTGAAISIHYYTVFLLLPLGVGVVLRSRLDGWRRVLRHLLLAGLTAGAVFVIGSPFLLPDWQTAWRDIVANRQIVVDRAATGGGRAVAAVRYLEMLWNEALGWPVTLLGLAGSVGLAWRQRRQAAFLLLFPVAFFAFICTTVPASRYLNPVLPFVAILAGKALDRLASSLRNPLGTITLATCAILAAAPGFWLSARSDWLFQQTDTRTLARAFIERHVPAEAGILIQPYSVPLNQSHASLREALDANVGDFRRASIKFALRLDLPEGTPAYRTIYLGDGGLDADKIYIHYAQVGPDAGLRALHQAGIGYVVLKGYHVPEPVAEPLRQALGREGRLLAVFSPYASSVRPADWPPPFLHNADARITPALERPGPIIEVWQVSR